MWPIRKYGKVHQRVNTDSTRMTCQAEYHIHDPDSVNNKSAANLTGLDLACVAHIIGD